MTGPRSATSRALPRTAQSSPTTPVRSFVHWPLTGEDDRNGAAIAAFELRNAAVRSPFGQPLPHGSDLQQPIKGGSVVLQVKNSLPRGHD
jgi:hypothetical protein